VRPFHAVIDIDSQNMLPRADNIIAYARKTAENAGQQLTKSRSRTRNGIINVGIARVALGLGFSWLIGAQHHATAERSRPRHDAPC
jgi:hypothetical protein